jgi:hypothetical protein
MVDSLMVERREAWIMSYNRKISEKFLDDLVNPAGLLDHSSVV